VTLPQRLFQPLPIVLVALLLCAAWAAIAQLEGGERGIAPIDSSSSYEVSGVEVDVAAKTADAARFGGWREAQRRGWRMLWGRMNGQPANNAPRLSDSQLDSIVAGIVVESEQIGPTRYIATLGVLFDRARAGQLLGVRGEVMRSPPMLVIPVMVSGGGPISFEVRNEWQRAWARFRPGGSPIDYVRPQGSGSDPLLLNIGQAGRRGRLWWRVLLDGFGAADIIVPEVYLERRWPGGPVIGRFVARHGPDNRVIESFTLRVEKSELLPRMLDEGVRRIDEAYTRALRFGILMPDPSLVIEEPAEPEEDISNESIADEVVPTTAIAYAVQIETPDPGALTSAENGLRSVPGVTDVSTTSLALGGVSVMRVMYEGDVAALSIALQARGWRVEDVGGSLRLRRGGGSTATVPPAQPGPPPAQ